MFSVLESIPSIYVPVFIFFARILDVSFGTLRIMFVSKGLRGKAAMLGFVEVFLWIVIVAQVFQNLDNWVNYVAYAGGFAAGTFVGMSIEEKMKMGVQIFRIIVAQDSDILLEKLQQANFRVTKIEAEGKFGPVTILFTIAKRKRWKDLKVILKEYGPAAFFSVEDVKDVSMLDEKIEPNTQDIITRMLKMKKSI